MDAQPIFLSETLAALPEPWPDSLLPAIQERLAATERTLVVLDDDPTGTQTVHDVPVLTEWSAPALQAELARRQPVFFVLTNSRSLPLAEAQALNAEIGRNLTRAAQAAGRDFAVVSRSDSTLRGHYPGEVDALAEGLGQRFDATLIIPFFLEGGRYTLNDIHYVAEGDALIPAAETPFARDAAFGYRSSDLRDWVEEKTGGRVRAADVRAISIEQLRSGGPRAAGKALMELADGAVCVVNAAEMRDMEVFVSGLLDAEESGKRFLYRTAASFVQARAGIAPRPLLGPNDLSLPAEGGALFVVGSYVPKTTAQVERLLAETGIARVEIDVAALLDDAHARQAVAAAVDALNAALQDGRDVVLYTSRGLITGADAAESLAIGKRVSDSLVEIVRSLEVRPRYLVAKGGITSSDIATKALDIRRAFVYGQALPGVPVWQAGPESRYPGLAYVVFPGNVGGDDALVRIVRSLDAD
ncbi:MAG: four-carbon acid sugar kinase family protein [Chloroflexota bacterium]|nr:four-carbon acid sugar kinase family protein [Chloroflexota bacterium]